MHELKRLHYHQKDFLLSFYKLEKVKTSRDRSFHLYFFFAISWSKPCSDEQHIIITFNKIQAVINHNFPWTESMKWSAVAGAALHAPRSEWIETQDPGWNDTLAPLRRKKLGACWTVPAGHELAPGGATERLHIVVLQFDSLRCQPVQCRGFDLGAVVPNIPEALIIHQDKHDVRLGARLLKLVPSVDLLGVPVFPRHLNAPRLGNDEAEEQTHRDPQDEHVSQADWRPRERRAASGWRRGGGCGRRRGAHIQGEQQHLEIGFPSCPSFPPTTRSTDSLVACAKSEATTLSVDPRGY